MIFRTILLIVVFTGFVPSVQGQTEQESTPSAATHIDREIPWRMTSRGWQDGSTWVRDSRNYEGPMERIHPVLLSVNILLGAFLVLIWFAPEEQVDAIMGRKPSQPDDE